MANLFTNNMALIIYLMSTTKETMLQMMLLMLLKMLESFLMNVEVIFLVKKQTRLEKKLYKKEAVYNFLKEKEQNGSLTNSEKKVLKKIDKYLKNFKNNLDKLQKYRYNITHGLDYLFNELDEEDYYKPTEVKIKMLDYQ